MSHSGGVSSRTMRRGRSFLGIEALLRDMRHGWQAMVRRKRFATTVVATIAVGIAANTSIFALVHAALLRPLPYPEPDRIVALREIRADSAQVVGRTSPARLEDWRSLNRTLDAIGGAYMDTFTNTMSELPTRLSGAVVSPGFFETLRTTPLHGRTFTADEERSGGPLVAVISERLWRQTLEGATRGGQATKGPTPSPSPSPPRTGSTSALPQVRLGTGSYTIVGVMPETFVYPSPAIDVWVPKQASAQLQRIRQARNYDVVGRLKAGVTLGQAASDLTTIQRQLGERFPRTDGNVVVSAQALEERIVGDGRHLWLVFGAGLLILLVTCANVGCLLLARAPARMGEMQTRAALGASRGDMLRQLVAEASAYAIAGGMLGLGVCALSLPIIRSQLSTTPRIGEVRVDVWIAAFVSIQVAIATLCFALAPAVRLWWAGTGARLAHAGRGVIGGTRAIRGLVIGQLSVATLLLIGAGLLAQSFIRLQHVPLGFSPERLLTFRVSASFSDGSPAESALRQGRVLDAVARVPGIQRVAAAGEMPGQSRGTPDEFAITDGPGPGTVGAGAGPQPSALVRSISWDYFRTLGVPLLAGETCRPDHESAVLQPAARQAPASAGAPAATTAPSTTGQAATAPAAPQPSPMVIVNRAFVEQAGGLDLVGKRLVSVQRPNNPPFSVIGVVDNVREEGYGRELAPIIYICGMMGFLPDPPYLARTAADPAQFARAVRVAVQRVEPSRAVYEVVPLTDVLAGTLATPRFQASLVGLFAAIAILLAAVGLYGVLSYSVALRTHEIGVRLALGADPGRVTREVVVSGLVNAATGIAAGMVMALLLAPVMARLLFGVSTLDLPTYLAVAVGVAAVAAVAAVVPAWRAGSLQPTEALRLE